MTAPGQSSPMTFLLGVGTQKAGTSWLSDYLGRHPQCAVEARAEMHFFDLHLELPRFRWLANARLLRLEKQLEKLRARVREDDFLANAPRFTASAKFLAMQGEPELYWRHFEDMVAQNPQARVVGEITPNYCSITQEGFVRIRAALEAHGYAPRVVFLMREPVERIFSEERMKDRRGKHAESTAAQRLRDAMNRQKAGRLTRYEEIVPKLEAVFRPEELFLALYEEFMSEAEVRRLCAFLGVDYVAPELEKKRNASPRTEDPDPADVATLRAHYAATYAFCRERFGAERIDRLWGPAPEPGSLPAAAPSPGPAQGGKGRQGRNRAGARSEERV